MRAIQQDTNAWSFRRLWAFIVVAVFSASLIVFGSTAQATITSGISAEIYTGYTYTDGVATPPTSTDSYTLCKTVKLDDINWEDTTFEGCDTSSLLVHYRGFIYSETAQTLYFKGFSNDGFYAKIGDVEAVSNWAKNSSCTGQSTGQPVSFTAGESKAIDAWYFRTTTGGACSKLYYATNSTFTSGSMQLVAPAMFKYDRYIPAAFTETQTTWEINPADYSEVLIGARGSGTIHYSIVFGSVPPGISLNETTGVLGRNSDDFVPGTYTFQIKAQAQDGERWTEATTEELTMVVGQIPTLTQGIEEVEGWIGKSFHDKAVFDAYPENPAVTINSGSLPPGVLLSADGTLSGAPTESGTYTFSLKATNFVGNAVTSDYTIEVKPAPHFDDEQDDYGYSLELGHSYPNYRPVVVGEGLRFSVVSGSLPPGLSLDPSTGALSGAATVSGSYTFQIKATNFSGSDTSAVSTILVQSSPRFTRSNVAENINLGSSYGFTFGASGYPAVQYFANRADLLAAVSGSSSACPSLPASESGLPTGLTLNSDGSLNGTPTETGNYRFVVCAKNDKGWVEVNRTINVNQLPVSLDSILEQRLMVGTPYQDRVSYTAFPPPIYTVSEGELPPGITLDTLTGAVIGSPTTNGAYSFKISVTSGLNTADTETYNFEVFQSPLIEDGTIANLSQFGSPYNDSLSVVSYPAASFAVTSGSLPKGITINSTTGELSGSPSTTGAFSFTITARNSIGSLRLPLTLTVQQPPQKVSIVAPELVNMSESYEGTVTSVGFPKPTFEVTSGALPVGIVLDPITGVISGVAKDAGTYTFTVTATNDNGTAQSSPFTLEVINASSEINVNAEIGGVITGAPVIIAGAGFKPNSPYKVVLRSTPQVIAEGITGARGEIAKETKIPGGLEPGWHSITVVTTNSDGSTFEKAKYFQITETLLLEEVSDKEPSGSQKAEALTNDPDFYARMGIDPAETVTPAAVAQQVQQVTSVVASVALVSAAAAGAAAAASAAGGAASSAGGSAGGARSSGGSSSGGSSGGNSSDDSDGGDYGNIEADHDDFETEGVGLIDRLRIWQSTFMTMLDKPLTNLIEQSAKVSPVLSRIINDGSYLRALFGSITVIGYFAAVILGIAAVDTGAETLATSGRVGILVAIMTFGTLDAMFGVLAMSAFVITSLVTMPSAGIGDVRYLLAMFILGFAPSIMATTFRKIRRPAIDNLSDAWERVIDLALIGFISVLTVMSLVGSVSAFAGATVPLGADVKPIAFAIAAVALLRVLVEEIAAKLAPGRLNRINPTEVPGTFGWQPWASLALKAGVLVVMIGGMVGMGWHLWVGTFLIFLPGIIGMVFPNLPSFKWIHEFIPGGVGALAFATLISTWSGQLVNALLGKSELYGTLSFILIPLPVILIAILGMFAKQEDKLWQRTGKKWIYIVGGIAVFIFTVQVTDFIPTIFG